MTLSALIQPCDYSGLPGWADDDHGAAFEAFRRCALHAVAKPYKTGSLGVDRDSFFDAFDAAGRAEVWDDASARTFFEAHFRPCRVNPGDRSMGFVTGYYEPVAVASRFKTDRFRYPVYRRPDDLIGLTDANRPEGFDPYFAFARQTSAELKEYHDRSRIERGVLAGRGLEMAWLDDPVELFFVHVQGAARLEFADGSRMRITYAAKSGHRFTGPGGVLASLGEIPREDVTMRSVRTWLAANPERIDEILRRNRSFIFFREAPVDDPALGDIAGDIGHNADFFALPPRDLLLAYP